MKLHTIIWIPMCLLITTCYASDFATRMSNQTQNLIDAQSALSLALGYQSGASDASAAANTAPFTYKNTTAISVIVALTIDGVTSSQNINPGVVYTQNIDPAAQVAVQAHANLSPIFMTLAHASSYDLAINDQADLALTVTDSVGSTIVNNSGWQVMISYDLPNNAYDATILKISDRFTLPNDSISITVIPMIEDIASPARAAQSCSIQNNNGLLAITF